MTCSVDLPIYQGPFAALAELILDQKVDVCDVSVATVTERFLARARDTNAESWNLEEATWFLAICSVLLELKVRRLMPKPDELKDEDLLSGSPDLAYARSIELAAFRRMAEKLLAMLEDGAKFHNRLVGPPQEFAHLYPDVMENVTPEQLVQVAATAVRPPPGVDLSHVAPIRASVSEAIRHVEAQLGELGSARFRDLVADCEDRIHVVVRFLALLELHREGKVELAQAETFGEIECRWQEVIQV
jgi:segregation and condensation protein A